LPTNYILLEKKVSLLLTDVNQNCNQAHTTDASQQAYTWRWPKE